MRGYRGLGGGAGVLSAAFLCFFGVFPTRPRAGGSQKRWTPEVGFGIRSPPPRQVRGNPNIYHVQKEREPLGTDHCDSPSSTENGPRKAELKLIFLKGLGGGEGGGERNGWLKDCAGSAHISFIFWISHSQQGPICPSGTLLKEIQ